MLWGLGRWLRAAGYDTATAARGLADGELLRRAGAEGRVLLPLPRARVFGRGCPSTTRPLTIAPLQF